MHGTNNTPDDVRDVTRRTSEAVGRTTEGANLWDNGFDWRARFETVETYDPQVGRTQVSVPVRGTSHQLNGTGDREVASERLADHVLRQVDGAVARGALDPDKPLTINLVGFSHGGNVSLLATDEIARGLRERGIDSAIHVATLSTPAYTWGPENPDTARDLVHTEGVRFAHTHVSTPGDGVIRAAMGRAVYDTEVTANYSFDRIPNGLNGIANHGAVQNDPGMMDSVAELMRQRFSGLAPAQDRSSVDEVRVAGLAPASAPARPVDWAALNEDPMVRDAAAALHRLAPDVPQENLNPNAVMLAAGVAAQSGFRGIDEVRYGNSEHTAFVINRDRSSPDPAAHATRIDLADAGQPLERLAERYAPALQLAQQPQEQLAAQQEEPVARMARA